MRNRVVWSSLVILSCCAAWAGVAYPEPEGGWTYLFQGDQGTAALPGAGAASLDGTWSHDNPSDEWDRTMIGGDLGETNRPGGAMIITEASTNYLRIQDTGDPRDYDVNFEFGDPGSNRRIFFIHDLDTNAAPAQLDEGLTLSFRARIPTLGTLDPLYRDSLQAEGPQPYPTDGDGYVISDSGRGNFVVKQELGGEIGFALTVSNDVAQTDGPAAGFQGLTMNSLNGAFASDDVDFGEGSDTNRLALDPTQWHEFWVVITADPAQVGTHRVIIYKDGETNASIFKVTAGMADDQGFGGYIGMGTPTSAQNGALDVDFMAYKAGAVYPPGAVPPSDGGNNGGGPGEEVQITGAVLSGNQMTLTFAGAAGKTYRVEYKSSVTDPTWTVLQTYTPTTGGPLTFQELAQESHRFYHVVEASGDGGGNTGGGGGSEVTLSAASVNGNQFQFHFTAEAGTTYRVEYRDTLVSPWTLLQRVTADAAGEQTVSDPISGAQRFYRVVTE